MSPDYNVIVITFWGLLLIGAILKVIHELVRRHIDRHALAESESVTATESTRTFREGTP
jgi:hypothetical protein